MPSHDLVPVVTAEIGDRTVNAVNARDLHAFLEVSTAFKDWISRRIEEYEFIEEEDFCSFLSESSGGRPSKDYRITLDMAKELAMVERTAKGREVRQYFIECEQAWRTVRQAAGHRDILLETCLREAGRGNLYAMNTLMTLYGYPSDLVAKQIDQLAAMRGRHPKQMSLPVEG